MKVTKVNLKEDNFKALSFKQLVNLLADVKTEEDFNRACGQIDMSFQHDKITWNDNELLYKLAGIIYKGIR